MSDHVVRDAATPAASISAQWHARVCIKREATRERERERERERGEREIRRVVYEL
jgi:hypothetical protein